MVLIRISYQHFINRVINKVVENSLVEKNKETPESVSNRVYLSKEGLCYAYFKPPHVPLMFLHCV